MTDSHCHLTADKFAPDRTSVLDRAREAGVSRIVCIASDVADAVEALELARDTSGIWATTGVHPHAVGELPSDTLPRIKDLAQDPNCVAVGETGLDYFYDHAPRQDQLRAFADQLRLAADLELPVVVHSREADEDMADVVREHGQDVTGVLHCFGGPRPMLDLAMEVGWYVSFTGICTFKRFDESLLVDVPADRYMLETDAPYLAPVPHRGKRNEPSFLPLIAARVAEARGQSVDDVARRSDMNAATFYQLNSDERL
ncbi:MAG: TatD family hydrolase [Longimicrobiales bacterium]